MTNETFATLPLFAKWDHLAKTMDYIVKMDAQYISNKNMFSLRKRYNPHHSEEQKLDEAAAMKTRQRNLRIDQYQRWEHVKQLYASHRDELTNTLDNKTFEECKSILESIFTQEVDDALRNILEEES